MTTVAVDAPDGIASDVVAEEEDSRVRNLRVGKERWSDFEAAVGERRRSVWLNVIIDCAISDPQLWRDIEALAKARGDTVPGAINRMMRKYRAGE
jgi:hypothetical protein